ncbi:MAG: SCP2 sterol-binding domain-containing protein [Thermoplasmataceae archaeon]
MASSDILKEMIGLLSENEIVKKEIAGFNKTFQFSTTEGMEYYVSVSEGIIKFADGKAQSPTVTISGKDEVLSDLYQGKADPVMSYMSGKIKVSGDIMSATKIMGLLKKLKK